jgi:hypothetical protein
MNRTEERGRTVEHWREEQRQYREGVLTDGADVPQTWQVRHADRCSTVVTMPGLLSARGLVDHLTGLGTDQVLILDADAKRHYGERLRDLYAGNFVRYTMIVAPPRDDPAWSMERLGAFIAEVRKVIPEGRPVVVVGIGGAWACTVAGAVAQGLGRPWARLPLTADAQVETATLSESGMDHPKLGGPETVVRAPVVTLIDTLATLPGEAGTMLRFVPLLRGLMLIPGGVEHLARSTPRLRAGEWFNGEVRRSVAWATHALLTARWTNPLMAGVGDGVRSMLVERGVDPNAAVSIDLAQTLALAAARGMLDRDWWGAVWWVMTDWGLPMRHDAIDTGAISPQGLSLAVPNPGGQTKWIPRLDPEEFRAAGVWVTRTLRQRGSEANS